MRPPRPRYRTEAPHAMAASARRNSLPTPSERPPLIPSSVDSELATRDARFARPDPRSARRRRGGRRVEPQAEVAARDRRQPPRRDQPDEARARVGGVDRAAGGDPWPRAAGRDGMGRRRLGPECWNCTASAPRSCCSPSPAWAGSAGDRCFGRRRRISGRSTRSASSRDTPCAAKAIRHLAERAFRPKSGAELARMRAMSCAGAGLLLAAIAALVAIAVWPATRWIGSASDLAPAARLIWPTLANADRHHVGLSCRGLARLGLRRRQHGPAARSRSVRRRAAGRARLAGRASLRHPYRRRALRLPDRERAGRAARQRAVEAGHGPPRGNRTPPGRSTSCSSPGT